MTLTTFSHVSKAKNFLVFEKHVKQEMQPLLITRVTMFTLHLYVKNGLICLCCEVDVAEIS